MICFSWSYGILLWEIFFYGSNPYPSVHVENLFQLLKQGCRMEKPFHATDDVCVVFTCTYTILRMEELLVSVNTTRIFNHLQIVLVESAEIVRVGGHYAVQVHTMSLILVPYATSCY